MFTLTDLEKAALLKKSEIITDLVFASEIHLKEMGGIYNSYKAPEGDWDDTSWYGGSNSGGSEGYRGTNTIHRVELDNKQFVILVKEKEYVNGSTFETDHDKNYPDGDCRCCGTFYYVFQSEGEDIDGARIWKKELIELQNSADKHLPEALEMLRIEAASLSV